MGLLDDAIREHLELKRRNGADPGAIAQAEHEALDPIFAEERTPAEEDGAMPELQTHLDELATPADSAAAGFDEQPPSGVAEAGFSNVGQETAELDMQAVLDERPPEATDWHAAERTEQNPPPGEIPGQERLTFD